MSEVLRQPDTIGLRLAMLETVCSNSFHGFIQLLDKNHSCQLAVYRDDPSREVYNFGIVTTSNGATRNEYLTGSAAYIPSENSYLVLMNRTGKREQEVSLDRALLIHDMVSEAFTEPEPFNDYFVCSLNTDILDILESQFAVVEDAPGVIREYTSE